MTQLSTAAAVAARLALAVIDLRTSLLPDALTLPLLWAGLFVNLWGLFAPLSHAVIGAMAGYGVLWAVYWIFRLATGKEGMGYGDFKLLAAIGATAWLVMAVTYVPMLRYYGQPVLAALLLPFTATLYLGMTVDSARRHYAGRGAAWKGRTYSHRMPNP